MAEIMENEAVRGLSWDHTSPELIEKDILVYFQDITNLLDTL